LSLLLCYLFGVFVLASLVVKTQSTNLKVQKL
jgi:hypothetical protein